MSTVISCLWCSICPVCGAAEVVSIHSAGGLLTFAKHRGGDISACQLIIWNTLQRCWGCGHYSEEAAFRVLKIMLLVGPADTGQELLFEILLSDILSFLHCQRRVSSKMRSWGPCIYKPSGIQLWILSILQRSLGSFLLIALWFLWNEATKYLLSKIYIFPHDRLLKIMVT